MIGNASASVKTKRISRKSPGREVLEWVVTLALAVALAFSIHLWVGGIVTVQQESMEPTLLGGEKVLTSKVEYYFSSPKRGDIVIVKYPDSILNYIKRVIAIGGEKIAIHDGSVYINENRLAEPYISAPIEYSMDEITVPQGSVFVMGDNRNVSIDSHMATVGPIPLSQVECRAYAVVWPLDKYSKLSSYAGKLEKTTTKE